MLTVTGADEPVCRGAKFIFGIIDDAYLGSL